MEKSVALFLVLFLILGSSMMAQPADLPEQLRKGLQLLYDNQLSEPEIAEKVAKSLATKAEYLRLVDSFSPTSVHWEVENLVLQKFQFPSAIQIPGSKNNTVYGFLYTPEITYSECLRQFPATLIVHHVADKITPEQKMAMLAARAKKGVVMIIVLPEYGKRKNNPDPESSPFDGSIEDFRHNLIQAMVDIRVSYNILKNAPLVNQKQVQIGGLSLGAAIAASMASFDPVFDNYLIGLGGGDMASIMTSYNNRELTVDGSIGWALKNVRDWKMEDVREATYDIDAMTWAYTVSGRKINFIAATEDEIFDFNTNVSRLKSAYEISGNAVALKSHRGQHVPDRKELGLKTTLKIYWRILSSFYSFLGESQSALISQCESQYR